MSYYYGVNFNWGLYRGLATSADQKVIRDQRWTSGSKKGQIKYNGPAFLLNKVSELTPSEEDI